jgi:branched-chain amino acid transport system ATP-binding protein
MGTNSFENAAYNIAYYDHITVTLPSFFMNKPAHQPMQADTRPLLRVSGLRKHFGGVKALDGVDFEVRAGQCVALIGPNGAGKSTCFAALCGQQTPDAGQVLWQGQQDITGLSSAALCRLGVARSFQVAQVFEALDVLSNVQIAMKPGKPYQGFLPLKNQGMDDAQALLMRVGLGGQGSLQAQTLPYGAKKRLELAIALAASPKLLLLDEPAAGLAAAERHALMAQVKALCTGGMAVLYTEHNMDAVFGVADHVLVLVDGRIAARGSADEIAHSAVVKQRYLGTHFQSPSEAAHA